MLSLGLWAGSSQAYLIMSFLILEIKDMCEGSEKFPKYNRQPGKGKGALPDGLGVASHRNQLWMSSTAKEYIRKILVIELIGRLENQA